MIRPKRIPFNINLNPFDPMHGTVLIAHCHEEVRTHFAQLVDQAGLEAVIVNDGSEALALSQQSRRWAGFLISPLLAGLDGLGLIEKISRNHGATPIIAIGDDDELMTNALSLGAHDYVPQNITAHRFNTSLHNALRLAVKIGEKSKTDAVHTKESPAILCHDRWQALVAAARQGTPILIEGERGTGKSNLAHSLAQSVPGAKSHVLCPSDVSAYAGLKSIKGAFETILILDDVDLLDKQSQTALNQALQTKKFKAVIATSTRCLINACQSGDFEPTLYYRLAIHPLRISPLRAQLEIDMLLKTALRKEMAHRNHAPVHISIEALDILKSHHWPHNLSELKWVLARACQFETTHMLNADAVSLALETTDLPENKCSTTPSPTAGFSSKSLEQVERDHIIAMLAHYEGRLSEVARQLDISRATLYRKIARFGLKTGPLNDEPTAFDALATMDAA